MKMKCAEGDVAHQRRDPGVDPPADLQDFAFHFRVAATTASRHRRTPPPRRRRRRSSPAVRRAAAPGPSIHRPAEIRLAPRSWPVVAPGERWALPSKAAAIAKAASSLRRPAAILFVVDSGIRDITLILEREKQPFELPCGAASSRMRATSRRMKSRKNAADAPPQRSGHSRHPACLTTVVFGCTVRQTLTDQ